MSTLPPVADPIATMTTVGATTPVPAAAVSTLAPSTVAQTARAARPTIVATTGRTAAGAQASTTATTTKSSSKSKKKSQSGSGGNSASVTMATATTAQSGGGSGGGSNGENTGRWTAEEHNLFLQGLELHGKGWKKIAGLIKSRTVVQIRTHAQKYFQKLAKAKQNGEDVTMAGGNGANGGAVAGATMMMGDGGRSALNGGGPGGNGTGSALASTSASGAVHATAHASKRRKQTSGTKRKAIQSVVASARRQGNKKVAVTSTARKTSPQFEQTTKVADLDINSVAPALAPYMLPTPLSSIVSQLTATAAGSTEPTAQENGVTALEDSLFRYLTPTPVAPPETQVNPVARQAGANPITLPTDKPGTTNTIAGGEASPTGVFDLDLYPSWTDFSKEAPTWYAKGLDVDALFDVADSLEWLNDTGDLDETYEEAERMNAVTIDAPPQTSVYHLTESQPLKDTVPIGDDNFYASSNNTTTMSMNILSSISSGAEVNEPPLPMLFDSVPDGGDNPTGSSNKLSLHIDSGAQVSVPSLPMLFDGVTDGSGDPVGSNNKLSLHMNSVASVTNLDEHLFSSIEEHEFVSTILEENGAGSSVSLSVLGGAP